MTGTLVLASRSPRRRELLDQVGIAYQLAPAAVDEGRRPGERPAEYVARLACAKASAAGPDDCVVLGADTAVVADADILGKPADAAEAEAMLARLSGRAHEVYTGVAVRAGSRLESRVVTTRVTLRPTSAAERAAYRASGEPADKAGAYAIQGLGAAFVEYLEGSYSNVVGLPLFETLELLRDFGIDPLAAARDDRPEHE